MYLSAIPVRAAILVAALISMAISAPVSAGEFSPARIVVTGEGRVRIAPDMANLALTVSREADTATAALDANSSAMKNVLAAMQKQGIDPADLQTSGFSIQPEYIYPKAGSSGKREARRMVGYTVRSSLTVRVRNLDKLGVVLDKSIALGVNEGGDIQFGNENPAAALSRARTLAVENATAKAQTLATAAGVNLGNILKIAEQPQSPGPMPTARAAFSVMESSAAVPIAAGENTYRVRVSVSFAIEQ